MTLPEDYLFAQTHKLVQHCQRSQSILRSVADWIDQGLYDPVNDQYATRIPGEVVRSIQQLLDPIKAELELDAEPDRSCDT